jgi:hypothetical protein
MMNKLKAPKYSTHLFVALTAFLVMIGCDNQVAVEQPESRQQADPASVGAVRVKEVVSRRSLSFSAGQIQMSYRLLDQPMVGLESRLQLNFTLPAQQNLELGFSDNRQIDLMQSGNSSYVGTDSGRVEVIIEYTPQEAGKTYLKFIASTADGNKIRAFAIAIPVADQTGAVPARKKTTKSRINLPSSN